MNLPPADCWFCRYCWVPILISCCSDSQFSSDFLVTGLVAQPAVASAASISRRRQIERAKAEEDRFMFGGISATERKAATDNAAIVTPRSTGTAPPIGRGQPDSRRRCDGDLW